MHSSIMKKRKTHHHSSSESNGVSTDTSKPSALFTASGRRPWTLSVALPGSIIGNAQSHDQKTFLAGTIARALAVFCVDEVVIFDDEPPVSKRKTHNTSNGTSSSSPTSASPNSTSSWTGRSDPSHFLAHILSFLETPPHLRKSLFPMHENLRTAGTLPSLDMPHHTRTNEWSRYREGVTYDEDDQYQDNENPKKRRRKDTDETATVHIGLPHPITLPMSIPPNTRITLKFPHVNSHGYAEAVAPTAPREDDGYYWGYTVRRCTSISSVFTECPFDGGYDLSFGTSERGNAISSLLTHENKSSTSIPSNFNHMIAIFGGVAGLEKAAEYDDVLRKKGEEEGRKIEARELFDFWVNLCPGQGSRTIRTEEAVWIGLMGLKAVVDRRWGVDDV